MRYIFLILAASILAACAVAGDDAPAVQSVSHAVADRAAVLEAI